MDPMASAADDAKRSKATLGNLLSFIAGFVGALVGGYGGYAYETGHIHVHKNDGAGMLPVLTAVAGFIIFFLLGVFTVGPGEYYFGKVLAMVTPPEKDRMQVLGLSSFDLYVTVHRVKNLFNSDPCTGFFGGKSDSYVEVLVGRLVDGVRQFSVQRNPPKRTCISAVGVFEECFHFVVAPTDDTIRFILWDQDVVDDDLVGMCDINITDDVLNQGFPQKRSFKMARGDALDTDKPGPLNADHHAGSLVASFAPGLDFPEAAQRELRQKSSLAFNRMQTEQDKLRTQMQTSAGPYGTMVTGFTQYA